MNGPSWWNRRASSRGVGVGVGMMGGLILFVTFLTAGIGGAQYFRAHEAVAQAAHAAVVQEQQAGCWTSAATQAVDHALTTAGLSPQSVRVVQSTTSETPYGQVVTAELKTHVAMHILGVSLGSLPVSVTTSAPSAYAMGTAPAQCRTGATTCPVQAQTVTQCQPGKQSCTPVYQTVCSTHDVPTTTTEAYTAYRRETQTYTYQVTVPETKTGTRTVRQAYTAYRTVPVTHRVYVNTSHWATGRRWVNTSHWATGRRWVSTGGHYACYWNGGRRVCRWVSTGYWQTYRYWVSSGYWQTYSYWVTSGYWKTTTTYQRQAYTAYRNVTQTYTYTVNVTETKTGTRTVQVPYTAYRTVTTYRRVTSCGQQSVGQHCTRGRKICATTTEYVNTCTGQVVSG